MSSCGQMWHCGHETDDSRIFLFADNEAMHAKLAAFGLSHIPESIFERLWKWHSKHVLNALLIYKNWQMSNKNIKVQINTKWGSMGGAAAVGPGGRPARDLGTASKTTRSPNRFHKAHKKYKAQKDYRKTSNIKQNQKLLETNLKYSTRVATSTN